MLSCTLYNPYSIIILPMIIEYDIIIILKWLLALGLYIASYIVNNVRV